MVTSKEEGCKLEWRINVAGGKTETLSPESCGGLVGRLLLWLKGVVVLKVWRFLEKCWSIGVSEPKKVMHGVKVGLALTIVSLFYYMRPLYEGLGGCAIWAVMTVVVVFEATVGATFCKCINRVTGTFLAGLLGIGVHWVATESGEKLEPIILGFSVFVFASAATFSRFVPSVKARFDYGALIFILTFSLVSVSSYRIDKLFEMAYQRLSTVAIGISLCIIISMMFWPIWAGDELHGLIHRNLEKLADSLDGCVSEYFKEKEDVEDDGEVLDKNIHGYKCVLNSKATEDAMANFAIWEPAHGRFNFRHPWRQYQKIGASLRSLAYVIENLNSSLNSEIRTSPHLKKHLKNASTKLTSISSKILKELATTIKTLRKSSKIDYLVGELEFSVIELKDTLKSIPNYLNNTSTSTLEDPQDNNKVDPAMKTTLPPLMEVLPLATLVSLLIENTARIEGTVNVVDELGRLAKFKPATRKKPKQNELTNTKNASTGQDRDELITV